MCIGRSIDCMLALGPRLVDVSVVVVVLVVVQPTSVNKPAQARHMIAFFIITVVSELHRRSILFCDSYPRFATSSTFFQSSAES